MIFGEKYRTVKVFKEEDEMNTLEGKIGLECIKEISKKIDSMFIMPKVDLIKESVYKEIQIENEKLQIGDKIQINRWDGNGIAEIEHIIEFKPMSSTICKVVTKKGSFLFCKDNIKPFIWNKKQKDKWIKEYMTNVYLQNKYIEI